MASVQYDLYNYVAANKPDEAKAVLAKYGYDASTVDTVEVLGSGLANLVTENGETALKSILSIHPDKDAIVQEFASTPAAPASTSKSGCGCGGGCKGAAASNALESYLSKANAPAPNSNGGNNMVMQHGNMLLIGGILILAVAIIVTHKN